jgi:hypothetical protein
MELCSSKSRITRALARTLTVAVCATPLRAQSEAALVLPNTALHDIAMDFDTGRNLVYCYHGAPNAAASPVIRVDSVSAVASASACRGLGIGFISRIDDRSFLIDALRGLIESNPGFRVVSAFYRVEIIQTEDGAFRSPRALSLVRGSASAPVVRAGDSGAGN